MTVAATLMSLDDFFAYDDGTDTRYELENGELIAMPTESELNRRIAMALLAYFLQAGLLPQYLTMKTEVSVLGSRATVRLPDLMVLSDELAIALENAPRSTVTIDMPPPRLVVEVVLPGKKNIDRDYRYKRSQYEARGIAEYWIVDPIAQRVTVLMLVEGLYETETFEGAAEIASTLLTELAPAKALTAAQVLNP
ncbi:Uma2 family endonuclease [Leptolyngbya sp. CCNP1308]|uniref:Uma2 family endonuclease n=1 Tax=Leptolyngbya sp. CCNP1308 TaxID=3110255 RepID=UPI002B1F3569|nr:Uma2 family endonuclease [Leptolyngbya sp. CCNP1308]MEA5447240.1 Uma2 family endonuclease [Leptolyngbya sp. CCNP1308]